MSSNESVPKANGKLEAQNVALIIGVTGIVGNSLAEILPRPNTLGAPWKVYGVARRPRPNWQADLQYEQIQCDVLNEAETFEKLSKLIDVTHIFYVAWVSKPTEAENCVANGNMLRNVLKAVIPNAPNLQHVCLQTGFKHYFGPFELYGKVQPHSYPFQEDLPRLDVINFYYTQEDILFEEVKQKEGLTWSVHRPAEIFGYSPSSMMNTIGAFSVYAAVCKHKGLPLLFPGNPEMGDKDLEVSDADLIAEQQIWASMDPKGKNEAFNSTNGDRFKWKDFFKVLAEQFEIENYGFDNKVKLADMMKDIGPVWDEIVRENKLVPSGIERNDGWWTFDVFFEELSRTDFFKNDNKDSEISETMNKSRKHGFLGCRNSKESAVYWIKKLKAQKIVP